MKVREDVRGGVLGVSNFLEMRLAAGANSGKKVDTNNNEFCFFHKYERSNRKVKKTLQTERKKYFCKQVGKK